MNNFNDTFVPVVQRVHLGMFSRCPRIAVIRFISLACACCVHPCNR